MARPLRIEYHGAWYHFTSRGNERNSIFKDDTDREKFLVILKDSLEKYLVQLHGYVLMENHFHLILHTPAGNLNRFEGKQGQRLFIFIKMVAVPII
ncbi:MAG: hypothetical protein FJ264_11320 [Planctomycetes bacterium]|nr:hypothetical protein [Planctomycetota bacterium]